MRLKELAHRINAQLHLGDAKDTDVRGVFAADTMSELIDHASPDTLLVTSLMNSQLIRVAELMDVPGICLVDGKSPDPELLAKSDAVRAAVLVSPFTLEETRSRIQACLAAGPTGGGGPA